MNNKDPMAGREVIFEFSPFGNVMKVSAMDTATLTEVVIQTPLATPRNIQQRNAMKRLEFVLRKKGHIS